MKNGLFITFEGSEAVGKSTIIQKVADFLQASSCDYIKTREPGGTALAEKIRGLIFQETCRPSNITELLLLFAARRDHLEQVIRPALDNKKIVLCDRFIDSTYIYQSVMNNIPQTLIDMLVDNFVMPTLPNVCFIIDCDAQTSFDRIQSRGIENRNDDKSVAYFHQLRNGFLQRSQQNNAYPYVVVENYNIDTAVKQITDYLLTTFSQIF